MKIHEAAESVLRKDGRPLHISEIVRRINSSDLFKFGAENPQNVVNVELARRAIGVDISKHTGQYTFYRPEPATYGLLEFLTAIPGWGVYELLRMLYDRDIQGSFLHECDAALKSDGALSSSVRNSVLYYMTRRLITFAVSRYRYYKKSGINNTPHLRNDLAGYLQAYTTIDIDRHGFLIELLLESVRVRAQNISPGLKNRMLTDARSRDAKCYLCGRDLDYENKDRDNAAQLEHIWPRALGGASSQSNLKVACMRCNQNKSFHMGSCDAHFERICLIATESDKSFLKELNSCDRLALLSKNECRCSICDSPAESAGEMYLNRADTVDVLHYFNVVNTCSKHRMGG
jgi:hypothetical protein